jgi:hypothetical protein
LMMVEEDGDMALMMGWFIVQIAIGRVVDDVEVSHRFFLVL